MNRKQSEMEKKAPKVLKTKLSGREEPELTVEFNWIH